MKATWQRILKEYKVSKKKNAGTIPTDVFLRLLKNLMLELPNQSDNTKAGLKKCGIRHLNKTPVVNRLPQESNKAVNNSVSEVFTEHLRQLRHGDDGAPRKMRRKRLDVVPGRSIVAPNSQQEAEASAPRAEPEAEQGASVMGAEASVSDDDEVELSSEDEWTPASERNIFNSFQC